MKRRQVTDPKVKPVKDEDFYQQWCAARGACHVCGIDAMKAVAFRFPGLSTHHIVKPGRAHESCNLIRTCQRCHDLAEGRTMGGWLNGQRVQYERLTVGMCLAVKLRAEPHDMDRARLEILLGQRLPDPEALPELLLAEWQDRQRAVRGLELAWDFVLVPPGQRVTRRPCFLRA